MRAAGPLPRRAPGAEPRTEENIPPWAQSRPDDDPRSSQLRPGRHDKQPLPWIYRLSVRADKTGVAHDGEGSERPAEAGSNPIAAYVGPTPGGLTV
jgi:hypothetical protein